MVSFAPKRRFLGEAAKTLEISNFKNTIGVIKRLAGRLYSDSDVFEHEAKYLNCQLVEGEGGEVAARVMYLNEPRDFTFTQLTAAFLTKVKQMTAAETGTTNVSDTVLSVPVWFGDRQRRAILDACEISGLNCLRILNDTTASGCSGNGEDCRTNRLDLLTPRLAHFRTHSRSRLRNHPYRPPRPGRRRRQTPPRPLCRLWPLVLPSRRRRLFPWATQGQGRRL